MSLSPLEEVPPSSPEDIPGNRNLTTVISMIFVGLASLIPYEAFSAVVATACPVIAHYVSELLRMGYRYFKQRDKLKSAEKRYKELIADYETELLSPNISNEREAQVRANLDICYSRLDQHRMDNADFSFFD